MNDKRNIITVSQLNKFIRGSIESVFPNGVWVSGELREFKPHTGGHWYFTLQDIDSTRVDCVMFRQDNITIDWEPTNGIKVEVFAYPTLYEKGGKYQLKVTRILPAGIGSRAIAFQQLKEKLEKLGLFSLERKRKLPFSPMKIGVATSITGAALRDIRRIIHRRAPWVTLIVRNTLVQGENAPDDIAKAIEELNKFEKLDLIIVGRGGGSEEDLWCFNSEKVAFAIFNSKIPVISAVGHETDFTIADFVADVRAPTPSGAAEIATPDKIELEKQIIAKYTNIRSIVRRIFLTSKTELKGITEKLTLLHPIKKINEMQRYIDEIFERAKSVIITKVDKTKMKVRGILEKLSVLSIDNVLKRGFSIVLKKNIVIRNWQQISKGDSIDIILHNGSAIASIESSKNERIL